MKKNIKIILASAFATIGVAASFGGAFALYTKQASNAEFSIGTYKHTSSGTITYDIGDVVDNIAGKKISPEEGHRSAIFKAPLGGYYSNDIAQQDYVYGNLRVDLTIPSAIKDTTRWCVYVDGYNYDSYWNANFNTLRRLTGEPEAGKENPVVGNNNSVNKDVAVNAVKNPAATDYPEATELVPHPNAANQWVVIYLDFTEALSDSTFLSTLAEQSFSIDIYFQGVSENCVRPVIIGDGNSWNKEAQEYMMVPNIAHTSAWEWGFQNLTAFNKMIIRVKNDGTDLGDYYVKASSTETTKDTEDNLVLDPTKTYHVYITGVTETRYTLYHHVVETTNYING